MSQLFSFFLFVFFASLGLTYLFYRFATRRGFVAIPNERSSHTIPTPTGAGLPVGGVFFAAIILLYFSGVIDQSLILALIGGLALMIVGWVDTHRPLSARVRLIVHAVAVAWVLWWVGGVNTLDLGFANIYLGIIGTIVAFIALLWMSNLYNFMDGIDGLIGSEAVMMGAALGFFFAFRGAWDLAAIAGALAASAAGFLVWNWHPAKVFMGDVGSVLFGFSFGVLALVAENRAVLPALFFVLLFSLFITDATLSTLRRVVRLERWFEAHHAFAYQRALAYGYNHGQVVLRAMGMNSVLIIFACLALWQPALLLPLTIIAFVLFSFIWWKLQQAHSVNR